jgi:hypothetical protein
MTDNNVPLVDDEQPEAPELLTPTIEHKLEDLGVSIPQEIPQEEIAAAVGAAPDVADWLNIPDDCLRLIVEQKGYGLVPINRIGIRDGQVIDMDATSKDKFARFLLSRPGFAVGPDEDWADAGIRVIESLDRHIPAQVKPTPSLDPEETVAESYFHGVIPDSVFTDSTITIGSDACLSSEPVKNTGNPKDLLGMKKPNVALVPPASALYQSQAMMDGAAKYGPYNWRENPVLAMVYVSAALRHIYAYLDGENIDPMSGVPHLGHGLACLGILADATETGNLLDDRPLAGPAGDMVRRFNDTQSFKR